MAIERFSLQSSHVVYDNNFERGFAGDLLRPLTVYDDPPLTTDSRLTDVPKWHVRFSFDCLSHRRGGRCVTAIGSSIRSRRSEMRKFGLALLLLSAISIKVGCIVPIYSSTKDVRARQLIFVSEGYRHIPKIWERIWGLDMPDVATPYRTHGGVI